MLCYLKFHFNQELSGEKHQHTTSQLLFFLKKSVLKNKKNI